MSIDILPLPTYSQTVQRLQALREVDVTCEIVVHLPNAGDEADMEQISEVIEAICNVLSVARGTKVQWIYQDYYGQTGRRIKRYHAARVTKRYSLIAAIDRRANGAEDTQRLIEGAVPVYFQRRQDFRLDRGMIDTYLDAKVEGDYLEMRAVKMVVALEALKDAFLDLAGENKNDTIIPGQQFKELTEPLRVVISDVLKRHGISDKAVRAQVYRKIPELNRGTFDALSVVC